MIEETAGGVRLRLLIQPKASKTEIAGPHDGALKIRIQAPPVDGRANQELVEFLSEVLGVPKRAVTVTAGDSSRRKTVVIEGLNVQDATARLLK